MSHSQLLYRCHPGIVVGTDAGIQDAFSHVVGLTPADAGAGYVDASSRGILKRESQSPHIVKPLTTVCVVRLLGLPVPHCIDFAFRTMFLMAQDAPGWLAMNSRTGISGSKDWRPSLLCLP